MPVDDEVAQKNGGDEEVQSPLVFWCMAFWLFGMGVCEIRGP